MVLIVPSVLELVEIERVVAWNIKIIFLIISKFIFYVMYNIVRYKKDRNALHVYIITIILMVK